MLYTFNSLTVDGRTYSVEDAKGNILPANRCGIDPWEYGGKIKYVGKTDTDIILLMSDVNTVFDTAVIDKFDCLSIETIQNMLDRKKIKYHHKLGKDKLIRLLEGKGVGDDAESA